MRRRTVETVVRNDLRRRLRAVRADRQKCLQYVVFSVVWAVFAFGVAAVALGAGRAAADGADLLPVVGVAFAGLLGAVVFFQAVEVLTNGVLPPRPSTLLVGASHREVVSSLLAVYVLRSVPSYVLPGGVVGIAFGMGAGSAASAVLVTVAVACVAVLGTLIGIAIGLLGRKATASVRIVAKYRTAIVAVLFLAYLGALSTGRIVPLFEAISGAFVASPLGWFGHVALLAVDPDANPFVAAGTIAVAAVGSLALVAVISVLADSIWYDVPVQPDGGATDSGFGRLALVDRPTNAVVYASWIRGRRSPIRMLYVAYPAVIALGPLSTALRTGSVPGWTPTALALYGAWATGAAFTLNPIGDELPALPVTVTTPVAGRDLVRGRWVAGAAVGAPITLALTAATSVLAGFNPVDVALVSLVGGGLALLAPGLAAGVGTAFPDTSASRVFGNVKAVTPSTLAFAGFSVGLAVLSVPMWAAYPGAGRAWAGGVLGASGPVVGLVAALATVAVVALGGFLGGRVAARRLDTYTVG